MASNDLSLLPLFLQKAVQLHEEAIKTHNFFFCWQPFFYVTLFEENQVIILLL